jgi:hypothetical protein
MHKNSRLTCCRSASLSSRTALPSNSSACSLSTAPFSSLTCCTSSLISCKPETKLFLNQALRCYIR